MKKIGIGAAIVVTAFLIVLLFDLYEKPRANVIVILVDALRADHLGRYGYDRETTPALDSFSGAGVTFLGARSQSSWTKPSIPSLFTALYPSHHGVFEGSSKDTEGHITSDLLSDSLTTMAEVFRENGYSTAAFVHNAQLKGFLGFSQGFDTYQDGAGNAEEINRSFGAWLEGNGDQPFFVYLHYLDVHWPYQPPEPYETMFGTYPSAIDFNTEEWKSLRDRINQGEVTLSDNDIAKMIALYDGELRYLDDRLGELFSSLKERGLFDKTLIVVTADHGEEFLEHGRIGHGQALHDELLRIPLLIKFPGGRWAGREIDYPAESVDILPTLTDYLGWETIARSDGQSLIPVIASDEDGRDASGAAYSERLQKGEYQRAVIQGPFKLIETFSGNFRRAESTGLLRHIRVGDRVEIAGHPGEEAFTVAADRIALDDNQTDDDDELEGPIMRGTLDGDGFRLMGFSVERVSDLAVKGLDGQKIAWEALEEGMRVKVNGHVREGGAFEADRVSIKDSDSEKYKLEGVVQGLKDMGTDSAVLSMMGCRIVVTSETETDQGHQAEPSMSGSGSTVLERSELFNMAEDPGERRNLASAHPEIVRDLESLMDDSFPSIVRSGGGSSPAVQELDPKTVEELKAIGYIE